MSDVVEIDRPPLGVRVLYGARRTPSWLTITHEELVAYRDAENRRRAARLTRLIGGFPDRGATIEWQVLPLPDRRLTVRVYQPSPDRRTAGQGDRLPLVLHVHGGGFVGTAAQSDWVNSHLAAQLPAVVISAEHRLLDHHTPLAAALDDGWDALQHAVRDAGARWRIDPERVALFGESTGALVTALTAIRAKQHGVSVSAQVLVNPVADITSSGFEVRSMTQPPPGSTLEVDQLRLLQRLAAPPGTDPHTLSPMHSGELGGLPPALVVVPTVDAIADHGRGYADRLRSAGTHARLLEYPGAPHAFLSMPRLVRDARAARAEIREFLRRAFVMSATAERR